MGGPRAAGWTSRSPQSPSPGPSSEPTHPQRDSESPAEKNRQRELCSPPWPGRGHIQNLLPGSAPAQRERWEHRDALDRAPPGPPRGRGSPGSSADSGRPVIQSVILEEGSLLDCLLTPELCLWGGEDRRGEEERGKGREGRCSYYHMTHEENGARAGELLMLGSAV